MFFFYYMNVGISSNPRNRGDTTRDNSGNQYLPNIKSILLSIIKSHSFTSVIITSHVIKYGKTGFYMNSDSYTDKYKGYR